MAKIQIKRKREPFIIEKDRAQSLKNRWGGFNGAIKAEPTEVFDIGFYTGTYSEIAGIEIEGEERMTDFGAAIEKIYTPAELMEFDEKMSKYRFEKKHWKENRMVVMYNTEQFLQDVHLIIYIKGVRHAVETEGQFMLQVYDNKIDQWHRWKERKEYAFKKIDEDRAALAGIKADVVAELAYPE